ncbi:ABC-F family ATP-binding cassette domain-containing protein [Nocardia higoensis]|uniref:ABC-F family ATP-binding cassette domain-containing protein n=1 Tax=Nocardia higoensis TaxID=228599 RepID=A0ABS0D9U7_9NOCA|nr:ATP-binding cassette domain-containing protein [Nocardia higoensis]MBF6354422.1 ABC-F family ATP-binding cassette domain-containing protein [Nocardia higoensis]
MTSLSFSGLTFSDLTFCWPDGTPVFDGLDGDLGPGHVGLAGINGAGKSTLLRLIAGELRPLRGSVTVRGRLGYLRQDLGLADAQRVDHLLGIAEIRAALHRVEAGRAHDDDFDVIGSAWDVEERAVALLARLGLAYLADSAAGLDRRLDTLSGGETVLLGLAAQLLGDPEVLLLDEPTNNLDHAARQRLYDVVDQFSGTVLAVSHDRELLERADAIAELRQGTLRVFGGNYTDYEERIAVEQQAARAAVRAARNDVRRQSRELAETRTKLDRRRRYGQSSAENMPKILAGARKRAAQESAGKLRNTQIERLDAAAEHLREAEDSVRADQQIRLDLPGTRVHPGQAVLDLVDAELPCGAVGLDRRVTLRITGPERIALTGRNGIGKTTLLRRIAAEPPKVPWRLLPQRLNLFDPERTVFENVAAAAPDAPPERIRAQLARLLFRGAAADVPAAALSGGERLRAALALLLLAEPAPKLLLLDEPTNNLDLPSLRHLTEALASFEGALIVVSHDPRFLHEIGVTRRWELTDEGVAIADAAG